MFKMSKPSVIFFALFYALVSFSSQSVEAKSKKQKSKIKSAAVFTANPGDIQAFDSMVGAMRSARAKEKSPKLNSLENSSQRVINTMIKQEARNIEAGLKKTSQGAGASSQGGGNGDSGGGNSNAGGNGKGKGPGGVSDLHKKIKKTKSNKGKNK